MQRNQFDKRHDGTATKAAPTTAPSPVDVSHWTGPVRKATADYRAALEKHGPSARATRDARRAVDRATADAGAALEGLAALEAVKNAPRADDLTPGALFNGLQNRAGFGGA